MVGLDFLNLETDSYIGLRIIVDVRAKFWAFSAIFPKDFCKVSKKILLVFDIFGNVSDRFLTKFFHFSEVFRNLKKSHRKGSEILKKNLRKIIESIEISKKFVRKSVEFSAMRMFRMFKCSDNEILPKLSEMWENFGQKYEKIRWNLLLEIDRIRSKFFRTSIVFLWNFFKTGLFCLLG